MRITTALGASLLLHLAVALVPSGRGSLATRPGDAHSAGGPAPLWVDLGPTTPAPVLLAKSVPLRNPSSPTSHRQSASAAALANNEDIPRKIAPQEESSATEASGSTSGWQDSLYLPSSEITTPARIQSGYAGLPEELARDVASGRLIVLLFISEQGKVDKLLVEKSEIRTDVETVIVGQLWSLRFSPATRGNQPVKSRMRMEITLQPPGPFMPPDRTSAAEN